MGVFTTLELIYDGFGSGVEKNWKDKEVMIIVCRSYELIKVFIKALSMSKWSRRKTLPKFN